MAPPPERPQRAPKGVCMTDDLAAALRESTHETFSMLVGRAVEDEAAAESEKKPSGSVLCGYIGVVGKRSGYVCLYIPRDLAGEIAEAMLGVSDGVTDEDVKDSIAELANLVAGGASSKLSQWESEFRFEVTLPSTIEGDNVSLRPPRQSWRTQLPFRAGSSWLAVEACVRC